MRPELKRIRLTVLTALLVAGLPLASLPAMAQQPDGVPLVRNRRPIRRPVIDLDREAKEVRPGQVVAEGDNRWPEPAAAVTAPAASEKPVAPTAKAGEPVAAAAAPGAVAAAEPAAGAEVDPAISMAGQPVRIVVLGTAGNAGDAMQAQWRAISNPDSSWQAMDTGSRTEERVEIRTGLSGSTKVEIDGGATLSIERLSRVRVERRARADASEISVELIRGRIELQPVKVDELGQAVEPIRIRTPDAVLLRRTAVAVTYDAFKGTRETPLNGR